MSPWTILERIASIIPRNNAITKTTKTTTAVPLIASLRVGHVTFFTSALTSPRNSIAFENIILKQVNTGQEGFEPPTLGFGIRCSTNSSYWPIMESAPAQEEELKVSPSKNRTPDLLNLSLFCFLMGSVFSAKPTILFKLQPLRGSLFIFCARIIFSTTVRTCKMNDHSHNTLQPLIINATHSPRFESQ